MEISTICRKPHLCRNRRIKRARRCTKTANLFAKLENTIRSSSINFHIFTLPVILLLAILESRDLDKIASYYCLDRE